MRPARRRAPNPDYRDPHEYLRAGYFEADGATLRASLRAERAAAMGRELLIRAVPLELVGAVASEVAGLAASDASLAERRARLAALAHDPRLARHASLRRLLEAGLAAVRGPADVRGLAEHMRRVHQLAAFERALGRANALERVGAIARAARAARLRADKRDRGRRPY